MERELLELTDRFTSAAVGQDLWVNALEALADYTGSSHAQLIGLGGAATVPFNIVTNLDEAPLARFVAIDGGNPDVNYRVRASLSDQALVMRAEEDYAAVTPLLRDQAYVEYAHEHDIPNGCQTKLVEGPDGMVGFALLRSAKDGASSERVRRVFAQIGPHVRSAVRTQIALEQSGPALLAGALDQVGAGVFIVRGDGTVDAMTPAAEAELSRGGLRLSAQRLSASDAGDTVRLRQVLARHATGAPLPMETLLLPGGAGGRPVLMDIVRAPRPRDSLILRPRLLVILRGGGRWHRSAPAVLAALYRLSPAEADIALRLADGADRDAIAQARGSSLATVRAQLKSIFAKVGVGRETELIVRLRGWLYL